MILYIFLLFRIISVSPCNFSDQNILVPNDFTNFFTKLELQQLILRNEKNIGFGIWMKYQPCYDINNGLDIYYQQQWQRKYEQNTKNQFIFSLISEFELKVPILILYITLDQINNQILYQISYSFQRKSSSVQLSVTSNNFEGQWIMFYIYFDVINIHTQTYLWNQQVVAQLEFEDAPYLKNIIYFQIGGFIDFDRFNQYKYILAKFEGLLSNIFSSSNTLIFSNQNILNECLQLQKTIENCQSEMDVIIQDTKLFDGSFYQTQMIKSQKSYLISAWLRLQEIIYDQIETVIIRISNSNQYSDDQVIGDKVLYLKYFQNQQQELNGFQLTTYSYGYPVYTKYTSKLDDRIQDFNKLFFNIFTQWHFIYKQRLTFVLNTGKYQDYLSYKWSKQINHFTLSQFIINIGGDQFSQNFMIGQIAQLQISFYCNQISTEIQIICHYSCETCFGPSQNNCLTCTLNSHRDYSNVYNTCDCQESYIDKLNIKICQQNQVRMPTLFIQEIELTYNKVGYNRCDYKIECSFGYFLYKRKCIQCPNYYNQNKIINLFCANCYLFPNEFSQNPLCFINFIKYNQNEDLSYQIQQLTYKNSSFFSFQEIDNNEVILILRKGFKNETYCLDGYYLFDSQCINCIENCRICFNQYFCFECNEGFITTKDDRYSVCHKIMETCDDGFSSIRCQVKCKMGYFLFKSVCVSCSSNCLSCDYQGYCKGCAEPQKHFITLNGKQCANCPIDQCLHCFQYFIFDGIIQSTLDINFLTVNLDDILVYTGCARCQDGYFYNIQTQLCQLKCNDLIDETLQGQCNNKFFDCQFGVIESNQQNDRICLIGKNGMQQYECQQIPNCSECILKYHFNTDFCIVCNHGFYSGIQSGQCFPCQIDNCFTCAQQNQQYIDYWKWNIKAFYKYFLNMDGNHHFELYATRLDDAYFEVICLECQQGYLLYNYKCIPGCGDNCLKCEIINSIATCVQCQKLSQGYLSTINDNGKCLECPPNCSGCYSRTDQQILNFNPYFIKNIGNEKYSRICFSYFYDEIDTHYFYDSYLQNSIICEKYQKCFKQATIIQKVFCSLTSYQNYLDQNSLKIDTDTNSILIDNIFSNEHIKNYETQSLMDYLNQNSFREITIKYQFFTVENEVCIFPNNTSAYSTIVQNVFALNKAIIILEGTQNIIKFTSTFNFSNFTTIIFRNLQISVTIGESKLDQYADIFINNLNLYSKLQFFACKFTLTNQNFNSTYMSFNFDYPSSITLENTKISNFKQINQILFSISSQGYNQSLQIQINNLIIENSLFENSYLFFIQDNQYDFQYNISILNLNVENTNFLGSNIIYVDSVYKQKKSTIYLSNSQFFNNNLSLSSLLFYQPTISDCLFEGLNFEEMVIQENSMILQAITFNLSEINFSNITLNNSTLVSNNLQIQNDINQDNIIIISQTIRNIQLNNIKYDKYYSIFLIINQNIFTEFQFSIIGLILFNSQYTKIYYKDFNEEIQYESTLMFFDCNFCYFQDIQIIRGYGLPEISISHSTYLTIINLHLTLYDKYRTKTLFKNFDCILEQSYNHNQAIFINFYKTIILNKIFVDNCIVFNSPLILIQGQSQFDVRLYQQISLSNSIFNKNILLVTQSNKFSSIIAIISQQQGITNIFNVTFINNHLNEYYQDVNSISATTLYISLIQCDLEFIQITLQSNIATNTTNTILHIKSNTIKIQESILKQNNIMNYNSIADELLFDGIISDIEIDQIFQIKSYGGNGVINSCNIQLLNIRIMDSYSVFGGGFYITISKDGIISIQHSVFINTVASLSSSFFSTGGCFYIDSEQTSLHFSMYNATFQNSYSRIQGGAIYIIPSLSENIIVLAGLTVIDCFALQDSFLAYSLVKQNNIISEVMILNSSFYSTKDGFEQFLSLVDSLQSEIETLQLANPLIHIKQSNATLEQIQFHSIFIQYLIHLEQCEIIKLVDISIQNSTYLFQPLIKINMDPEILGQLTIHNMLIMNVQKFHYSIKNNCTTVNKKYTHFECPKNVEKNQHPQINFENQIIQDSQLSCNLILFTNNQSTVNSLIQINSIYENQTVSIFNLTINQVICDLCTSGIILFDFSQQVEKQQVKISNSNFLNSTCGLTGCVSIFQNSSFLTTSNRLLSQYNYNLFDKQIAYQIEIEQSQFIHNSASYGGGLFVQSTQVILKNNKFQWNKAEYGGAVYFTGQTKRLIIFNCFFSQNQAVIAGGIYSSDQSFQLLNQLDVFLADNNSTYYGNDITEKPQSLSVSFDNLKTIMNKTTISQSPTKLVEQIIVKPYKIAGKEEKVNYIYFPSGQQISNYQYFDEQSHEYIAYNLAFRIVALDKFNKQEKNLMNQKCNLYPSIINSTSNKKVSEYYYYFSQQEFQFNETSDDFNLDDLIIFFNPNYPNEIILRILINCNMISIPIYDDQPPFQIINQITDYSLIFEIKTFNCQVGEYLNQTSGGCILCDANQNQYSVIKEATGCQFKDDNKINKITPATLQLRETYWRAYFYSTKIEYCYHLEDNCLGGWLPGDDSCVQGHIGGLCEQCDLYNIRSQGYFYRSDSYQCGDCTQIVGNIFIIILITIWTFISIALTVNSTVQKTQEFIIRQRFKFLGMTAMFNNVSAAILIKLFTNYLQIVSTIASFQLKVPSGLSIAINSVGNPISQGSFSLDCFLFTLSSIDIIYFRLIWEFIMIVLYILLYYNYGLIRNICQGFKLNISQVTTPVIYAFIYFQPNLISGLMSLLSYREISDIKWVQGNVSYLYDTNTHKKWLMFLCIPSLFIFGIAIPLILWQGLYRNRFKLNAAKVRQIWGYLFNEYKLQVYFWESIKMLEKEIILIVLIFYEDFVQIKASLVFLVLFAYSLYTTIKKPYLTGKLNELDSQATIVCSASIILGSSIYSAQINNLYEIQLPFYLIIILLNTLLTLKLISQIFLSYFTQYNYIIRTLIVQIFSRFTNYHPCISKLIQNQFQQKEKVKANFAKIKEILIPYVRTIIELKKINYPTLTISPSIQPTETPLKTPFEDFCITFIPQTQNQPEAQQNFM